MNNFDDDYFDAHDRFNKSAVPFDRLDDYEPIRNPLTDPEPLSDMDLHMADPFMNPAPALKLGPIRNPLTDPEPLSDMERHMMDPATNPAPALKMDLRPSETFEPIQNNFNMDHIRPNGSIDMDRLQRNTDMAKFNDVVDLQKKF